LQISIGASRLSGETPIGARKAEVVQVRHRERQARFEDFAADIIDIDVNAILTQRF
jgi:hypothetical protein